jgi:hypothetical protein
VRRRLAFTLAVLAILIITAVAVPLLLPGRRLAALRARARTEIDEESRRVERIPVLRGEPVDGDLLDRVARALAPFPSAESDPALAFARHVASPLQGGRLHALPKGLVALRASNAPLIGPVREALRASNLAWPADAQPRVEIGKVWNAKLALEIDAYAHLLEGDAEEGARCWADSMRLDQVLAHGWLRFRNRASLRKELILACVASLPDDEALARVGRELALLEEGMPRLADLVRRSRLREAGKLLSLENPRPTEVPAMVRDWTAIDRAFREVESDLDRRPPREALVARIGAMRSIGDRSDTPGFSRDFVVAGVNTWIDEASILRALRVVVGAERFRRKHGRPPTSSEDALGEPCVDPLTGKPMRFAVPFEDVLSAGEERLDVLLRRPRPGPRDTIGRLDFESTDLRAVARLFSERTGHPVFVAPEVNEKVTLTLARAPWRRALEVVARLTKCELVELPRGTVFFAQPPRVTIQFTDASLRTVLQLLAAYCGRNIVLPPGDLGDCSTDIHEVLWSTALRQLAWGARLDVVSLPPRHDVIIASRAPPWRPPLFLVGEPARWALPFYGGLPPRQQLVDLDADDEDLDDVLRELQESLGIELRLEDPLHEKVTLSLCETPWQDALAAIAMVTHTQMRSFGIGLEFSQPKVTVQASGCPAATWFELVGRALDRPVVVPRDLPGELTLDLKEIADDELLRVSSIAFGYDYADGDGEGEIRIGAVLPTPPRQPPATAVTKRIDPAALSELVGRFEATRKPEDGVGAGNALLGSMARDNHAERYEAALATVALIDSLIAMAKDVRDDGLARNMDAVHVRAKALADEARKKIEIRDLAIDVRAILIDSRPGKQDLAVVSGAVLAVGDALPGHPDVTLFKINEGSVTVRRGGVELVADLKAPD